MKLFGGTNAKDIQRVFHALMRDTSFTTILDNAKRERDGLSREIAFTQGNTDWARGRLAALYEFIEAVCKK